MSLFSERDPNEITADTFRFLRESMDFCDKNIDVKTRVDRLLNRVYYWWLSNAGMNGEGYSVGVYNVCSLKPGHSYYGEEYCETDSHGYVCRYCPELQEFLDEMTRRGFNCDVDTLNNRIHFTW